MALTEEQLTQMDAIVGGEDLFAQMDAALQEPQEEAGMSPFEAGLGLAASAVKGATFGLGPKIAAGVGTLPAKGALELYEAMGGPEAPSVGDIYKGAVSQYSGLTQDVEKQMPYAAMGAELAGGITGGVGIAGTKAAQALGNMARRGGLIGRVGAGALAGETAQRTYEAGAAPVGQEGEILGREGVSLGGVLGGAIPAAGALGRAVTPRIAEGLESVVEGAKRFKIPLSMDQVTGSRALKNTQKVTQELPFSGQEGFRDKQMKAFNRALLKTVGVDGEKISRANIDKAFLETGKKFDSVASGKIIPSTKLQEGIKEIYETAPEFATQDAIGILEKNVSKVFKNIDEAGNIKGEKLNTLRSQINQATRKAKDADTKDLLRDLENVIVESLTDADPAKLTQAKYNYKNLLAIEPLAAKAKGGDISVPQLTNRVDRIYGRSFVRGKAGDIGELADIGRELLPELGGSDTAQKMAYYAAIGGSALDPTGTAPLLAAGAITGGRAFQSFINRNQSIINSLPKAAREELLKLPPSEAVKVIQSLPGVSGIVAAQ